MSKSGFGERGMNILMYTILEILERKNSLVKEQELFNSIKSIMSDISPSEFNKALMNLEIRGLIEVDLMKRGTRVIRLIQ
ncbi:MAG: hypothetical protein J7L11_04835 [Thermoprotei archaeon]|nr:hypothetical protein [Thermoprotei archaeon]